MAADMAAAAATATATTGVEAADWALAVRQVFQDVQLQALEVSAYHFRPDGRHQRTLVPALRRLGRLFEDEVRQEDGEDGGGGGGAVAEEGFALFLDELWLALARVVATPKAGDVVLEAVAALAGEFLRRKHDKEAPAMAELRAELLVRVAQATRAEDKGVRLRACQVLQLLLHRLDEVEKPLAKKLRAALLPRLHDKVTAIRVQAIYALRSLQDPEDEHDKATAALQQLMVSDPSKDVRKAAVASVSMTDDSFAEMLVRIRDASEDVRTAAFQALGSEMNVKDIPINDRVHMLDQGLQDRSARVRRACEHMVLRKWLPALDRSPIALLKGLDIEQNSEIASKVCRLVLKHLSDQPRAVKQSDEEELSAKEFLAAVSDAKTLEAERVFYWKEQCYYYQKVDRDTEKTAVLLPNISEFAKLLVAACQAGSDVLFVALQLLALGRMLDFQDEFGRRALLDALQRLLRDKETDGSLITSIMDLMAFIYAKSSEQEFIQVVAEIASDLYEPVEEDSDNEDSAVGGNKLSEEEFEAATKKFEELEKQLDDLDFDSPAYNEVQSEMIQLEKLLQDPRVLCWLRCLDIVSHLLRLTSVTLNNPIVAGMGRYIVPAIESDIPALRDSGMECMGLYGLLDKRVAERYLIIFWRALNNDEEERDIKMTCIKAILDMTLTFKDLKPRFFAVMNADEDGDDENDSADNGESKSDAGKKDQDEADADGEEKEMDENGEQVREEELDLDSVYIGLARLIAVDDLDIQSTIVEGFARLFLLNRIQNVAVLAILLETYFSPKLQDVQLQGEHGYQSRSLQLLSVFFPAFASASVANCTLLEEAAMHLVQKSMEKEDIESGAAIDLGTCAKYVLQLLAHREEANEDEDAERTKRESKKASSSKTKKCAHHNRIAINISMEILALENIAKETTTIPNELVVARQRMLVKVLVMAEISARERRSGTLMLFLLQEVAKCFPLQRALVRSAQGFVKRATASFKEQAQKNGDSGQDMVALEQDQQWAKELIQERQDILDKALEEAGEQWRKQQQRSKRLKRRHDSSESESSDEDEEEEEEEDNEEEDDEEEEDGKGAAEKKKTKKVEAVPARREMSSRRSKTAAVNRMQTQEGEFDARLKQALKDASEDSEEEDEEMDEDDEDEEDGESEDEEE